MITDPSVEWNADMDSFMMEFEGDVVLAHKALAFELWTDVTIGSPVLSGRFRAAWNLSLDTPDTSVPPEGETNYQPDSSGLESYGSGSELRVIWINNQLPYARRLEDGWSKGKAPNGVFRIHLEALGMQAEDGLL